MDEVWSERNTTPAKIEAALRQIVTEHHHSDHPFVPARVLNVVVVVDGEFRGEIENRFERVGRYHPSRLVLCAVEPGRDTIDAWAGVGTDDAHPVPGHIAVARERVEIEIGPRHLSKLDTIVDPLLVTDLATMVWAPHGHAEAIDALRRLAQIVLVDTQDEPDVAALAVARRGPVRARLRGRPRVAALDAVARARRGRVRPAAPARGARRRLRGHRAPPRGLARRRAAVLRLAVLAPGLEAGRRCRAPAPAHDRPRAGAPAGGADPARAGPSERAGARRRDDRDRRPARRSRSTARPAGCRPCAARATAPSRRWTVLGASRGEGGILGEGVRQALLRDPTYRPALACARELAR